MSKEAIRLKSELVKTRKVIAKKLKQSHHERLNRERLLGDTFAPITESIAKMTEPMHKPNVENNNVIDGEKMHDEVVQKSHDLHFSDFEFNDDDLSEFEIFGNDVNDDDNSNLVAVKRELDNEHNDDVIAAKRSRKSVQYSNVVKNRCRKKAHNRLMQERQNSMINSNFIGSDPFEVADQSSAPELNSTTNHNLIESDPFELVEGPPPPPDSAFNDDDNDDNFVPRKRPASSNNIFPIKAKRLNKNPMKHSSNAARKKILKKAWQREVQEIRTQLLDEAPEKLVYGHTGVDDDDGVNTSHEVNRKRKKNCGGVSQPSKRRKMLIPSTWIQQRGVKRRRDSHNVVVSPEDYDDETGVYIGLAPPKRRKITVLPSQLKREVVARRRKRVGGLLEKTFIPYNPNIVYEYYDNPNELCDRLRLLYASQIAGNSNHSQEINSISEELRERGIIQ